ncbi:MAG: hypothetical protein D6695_04025 [Planctomycetota bacterium]|nr:MAG: hypothetical protein D6695_04025 [Planctomycetota bacterium]
MLSMEPVAKIVAASLGLCGFVVSVISGLAVENMGTSILSRALVVMLVCYWVGMILGTAGRRCIEEFLENYRKQRPVREEEMRALEERLQATSTPGKG